MKTENSDIAPAPTAGGKVSYPTVLCWIGGCLFILLGLGLAGNAEGWRNQVVAGLVTSAGGIILLPPVLERLRRAWPWARSRWVPALFAVTLFIVPPLIGAPFTPSEAEQMRLREDAIREARQLTAKGDFAAARLKLAKFATRPDHDETVKPALRRIDEVEAAAEKRTATLESKVGKSQAEVPDQRDERGYPDPAAVYVERVKTYWLPQVESMSITKPADIAAYGKVITNLDELRRSLANGQSLTLTTAQKAVHSRFAAALAAKQRRLYPVLRRRYAELLDAQLFRSDVRVSVSGHRAQTISLVGRMFVRNANVEDMQTGLASDLGRGRFRKAEYRWSPHVGGSLRYDLQPPADADVTHP